MGRKYKKYKLFVPEFAYVDYETASDIIVEKAIEKTSFGVTALAVHGLIESVYNFEIRPIINKIDLIVPDGQPVRWAINSFYKLGMSDRVSGPELTSYVLSKANELGLKIFLFGSSKRTLELLVDNIKSRYPQVVICGVHQDRFREATDAEDKMDIKKISDSGAHIVLVGRGCPRQELWVANHKGKINAVMMAVGAAFDFHAGTLRKAPHWMQQAGLEWLFRLVMEPQRLWKRYLYTNALFIYKFLSHKLVIKNPY